MKNSIIIPLIFCTVFCLNSFAQSAGWEVVQSNTTENFNSIYFFDYQFGIACGDSGIILSSHDGGVTWQSLLSPVNIDLNGCIMRAQDCILAVGDSAFIILSDDGGSNWYVNPHILELNNEFNAVSTAEDEEVASTIFVGSSQMILLGVSTFCNGEIVDSSTRSSGGFWDAQMLSNDLGFIVGEDENSFPIIGRTAHYSINWDFVSFSLNGNEGCATGVAFADSLNGYISAKVWDGRGAVCKTIDNGDTWTTEFFSKPLNSIYFPIIGSNQVGYCVGDFGTILKTTDSGINWQNQYSGVTDNLNKVYFIDSDFGFAVGDNGIILRTTNGGVSNVEEEIISEDFTLYQNYPNPFNPATKISWQSTVGSWQTLKVYDVLGNEVATLVDEYNSAGKYEVDFNAESFPSAVYFYQIKCADFIQTKKMILMK